MNLVDYENQSIIEFVGQAAMDGHLKGRVLDYGCGKQPYREIVQAGGGEYIPFDRAHFPANQSGDVGEEPFATTYDAILCTQVIQYAEFPPDLMRAFKARGRVLVMTYPTNWPEVQDVDLHRFTKAGMTRLLDRAGFTILRHERRGYVYDAHFPSGREKRITASGFEFALGYGVVARV